MNEVMDKVKIILSLTIVMSVYHYNEHNTQDGYITR